MADLLSGHIAMLAERNMQIFLGPRPGKKSVDKFKSLEITHCCTLLSEREDAEAIGRFCEKLGCSWLWLPMAGGRLEVLRQTDVAGHIETLSRAIADETQPRVYFHCSAGIHRTGFFVYVLLRLLGATRGDAVAELTGLRAVTAQQVGGERLDLADEMVAALSA